MQDYLSAVVFKGLKHLINLVLPLLVLQMTIYPFTLAYRHKFLFPNCKAGKRTHLHLAFGTKIAKVSDFPASVVSVQLSSSNITDQ